MLDDTYIIEVYKEILILGPSKNTYFFKFV